MLLGIAWIKSQLEESASSYFNLSLQTHFVMLCSCILGFSIGLAYYFLLKLVSGTSIAIANTFYKLLTLVASLLFWGVEFHYIGSLGIILSFSGIISYVLESQKKTQAPTTPQSSTTESQEKKVVLDIEEAVVRQKQEMVERQK